MTNTDTGVDVVTEPDTLHREVIQVRMSRTYFLEMLKDAAIEILAQSELDTSLVADLSIDDIGWAVIGSTAFVTFNEPWPDGMSQAETLARYQAEQEAANAGTTTP